MKLLQGGRLLPERQGPVVEMICKRGNAHDLRVIFDRIVAPTGFAADLRMKSMDWLTDAAATRKVVPTGDLTAIVSLVSSTNRDLQLSAIRLAAAWKVEAVGDNLQAIALDSHSPVQLQRAAMEGLVVIDSPVGRAKTTMFRLAAKGQANNIRMLAVRGLAQLDLAAASEQAASLLAESTAEVDSSETLLAFLDRKDGSETLAAALSKHKLNVDVAKKTLRYMYSIGRSDPALSAVLSEAAGVATDPPPPTQEEVAQIGQDVLAKGDAARGEGIFRRADLSCQRCHAINRAGGQVGPDLSAIGRDSPIDYVVNSILNPNLAVKELYVTKVFLLDTGKILTGVVVDRDDNRVLVRDSQSKTVTIATADIEDEAEGKSLMPQGLTKFLTRDEVLDLARFIYELGKPGPFEARKTPSINLWRIMTAPPDELTKEVPHLEHIRQLVLNSAADQWISAYSKFSGALPLNELRSGNQATVKIIQGEIQINEAGKLKFQVRSTEPWQIWLNDQPQTNSADFEAMLATGRHKLTGRIELSDRLNPELQVDVVRPADSQVQFEVGSGS